MDKAYIVANKEQELDVLKKLEKNGFKWGVIGFPPTKFRFSEAVLFNGFPYMIGVHEDTEYIGWLYYSDDFKGNVVYDGRKEEKMYKVTQEFMSELTKWRDNEFLNATDGESHHYIDHNDLDLLPNIAEDWRLENENAIERNNRLIAIIQWLNGEDVFEVEEQHKFVVRSDKIDNHGNYSYITIYEGVTVTSPFQKNTTKFDTREEAQEWANSHQVVVEIDAEGNEVE